MPDWVLFILVLGLAAGVLIVGTAYLMARALLRPPRMTDAKANWVLKRLSPEDLGMAYERQSFKVREARSGQELTLAGWWIPADGPSGRTVLLVHGYADAKVGAIAWAPLFHSLGWNILAIDLRAHGESGGRFTTAGYYERHDLDAVINTIRAERPGQTEQLVLFGASMGAAVVCVTAVEREDLAGVILESPFADFRNAVTAHFELIGSPGPLVQRLALRFAQSLSGANFEDIRPVDLIPRIAAPLLLIQGGVDPFVSSEDDRAIQAAVEARGALPYPTEYWRVDDVPHLMAVVERPEEYWRRVQAFLDRVGGGVRA